MAVPLIYALGFLAAICAAGAILALAAWRGSKPSAFFLDAVKETYDLQLPEAEIDMYYELKDKLWARLQELRGGGGAAGAVAEAWAAEEPDSELWVREIPEEERNMLKGALVRRLVGDIDRLNQVQKDKPGNWKLWRGKLVSEHYWESLCDAERLLGEEIDACLGEAEALEAGWRDHVFPLAVQHWRVGKARQMEKKVQKKAVEHQKKAVEKEGKKKEVDARLAEDQKKKQERLAEKAMEQLMREEENQSKVAKGAKGAKVAAKPKAAKKK